MIPTIAIVGRPNTGKSTLFNRLTRTRNALVADRPGVTRDRHYGFGEHDGKHFIVIDTGGLGETDSEDQSIVDLVSEQSWLAVKEADIVFWMVDGRDGLTATDEILSARLRQTESKLFLLVNKTEGLDTDVACADFHALGVGTPWPVSASRGDGVDALLEIALDEFPVPADDIITESPALRISVVGRPNVGKSTLVNRILGEERMLTFDKPGTTRDSIMVPFQRHGKSYELVDTAGVRRRSQLTDTLEKFSVIKTLQAIEKSHIIIMVIDASEALTDQDLHLLGVAVESGKPLVIAINKWDGLDNDQRRKIRDQLDRKLVFAEYACIHFISALHGSGVGSLFSSINKIQLTISIKIKSSLLTDILAEATGTHAPPLVKGRRIKLRYAHLGGHNPLRVIIHGNQTERVPANYARYLAGYFRKRLGLVGTPIMIEFKYSDNPYKNKPNVLSDRQIKKRRRLINHSRK